MRSWFSWLLVFGVIVGLGGRVLALDHSHGHDHATECCGHDQDSHGDHHGPDCPPGPHEHHSHACCHPAPLAGVEIACNRVPVLAHSWLGVTWWTALPPDAPVFELDKPPLI
ncbi:hypothetical protein [Luteolibacter marinus]|uniref:hypothetical protein n=1 Tax=Luteolibacter marinus TaxID=2776705 RepID=UPI00186704FA|nr:hypothetical protein [Luteolibacter marinus]